MEDANHPAAARWGFDGVWTEQRERIGVTADDERIDGQIELRFGWASRRCGCLFRALFRQVCVSPTRREAGLVLNPEPRMTGHVGFDSRVLRGVFQEVSRVGRVSVSGLPNSNHSRKEARGFVRRRLPDWFRLKTPLIVLRARAKRRERSTNGRSNRCDPRQSCTANSAAWAAADPEGLTAPGELISLSRDRARPPLEYPAHTDHSSAGGLQILERH